MRLGGVDIACDMHLVGHSDADAVCHAITDALLGAAALGDIGSMFPDSAQENRGRDSIEMLTLALQHVQAAGFAVHHVDVTVIAEQPRIGPSRAALVARLTAALGIDPSQFNIKGKSNEGMGWIGRGEGLACIAVATLSS